MIGGIHILPASIFHWKSSAEQNLSEPEAGFVIDVVLEGFGRRAEYDFRYKGDRIPMEIADRAPGDVLFSANDKGGIFIAVGMIIGADAPGAGVSALSERFGKTDSAPDIEDIAGVFDTGKINGHRGTSGRKTRDSEKIFLPSCDLLHTKTVFKSIPLEPLKYPY